MKKLKIDPRRLPTPVICAGIVVLAGVGYYIWLRARFGPDSLECGPGLHRGAAGLIGIGVAVCAGGIVALLRLRCHARHRLLVIAIGIGVTVGIIEFVEWLRVLGTHGCLN